VPHQHEIPAPVAARLFDRNHISWGFDHAQQRRVPM
jgi:hypothetical protein